MDVLDMLSGKGLTLRGNRGCMVVDNVRVEVSVEVSLGPITEVVIRGVNYNMLCKLLLDTRYQRFIHTECTGFKADNVASLIQEVLEEKRLAFRER